MTYWMILLPLFLIFYILLKKSRVEPLTLVQVSNIPLSQVIPMYLNNVKQRFDKKTIDMVKSQLKVISCVPPAQDMTLAQFDAFYKRRATDTEWNRLKNCGWLWNAIFINSMLAGEWFVSSLTKKSLTLDDFVKIIKSSIEAANELHIE